MARQLMQDENSGRDGRRYNEWFAAKANARQEARQAAREIAEARSIKYAEPAATECRVNIASGEDATWPLYESEFQ